MGYPQKLEDFDEAKGVKFTGGRDGKTVIEQVIIYTHGILLDTRESTEVSQRTLESAFEWAGRRWDSAYPQAIRRWSYYSQIAFTSTVNLSFIAPCAAASL